MSEESKSFYRGNNFNLKLLGGIGAISMVALSTYLTKHYFEVKFPTGLHSSGLCNINSFFNCDVATHSHLSNIMGVPISFLGLLLGLFVLIGFLIKNKKVEGTVHSLLWLNAVGCISLFFFSLIVLKGLCPACTLYYVFSLLTLFAFHRTSKDIIPSLPVLLVYGLVYAGIFGITYSKVQEKINDKKKIADSLIKQYETYKDLGSPEIDSEYYINKGENPVVKIHKFSDFQCPACRMLSEVLHEITKKYPKEVSIQYYYYPLDSSCNPSMQRAMHPFACKAAYLSACDPEKFPEMEKELFDNQESFSDEFLDRLAEKYGVAECYKTGETKEKVHKYIEQGKPFNIRSTPTFLLNGVKIEGALPVDSLSILIDHLIKKANHK